MGLVFHLPEFNSAKLPGGGHAGKSTQDAHVPPTGSLARQPVVATIGLQTIDGTVIPLIIEGSVLPAQARKVFATTSDNQSSILIRIVEFPVSGSHGLLHLGTMELSDIRLAPKGANRIEITFEMTFPGFLSVSAREVAQDIFGAVRIRPLGQTRIQLRNGAGNNELNSLHPTTIA